MHVLINSCSDSFIRLSEVSSACLCNDLRSWSNSIYCKILPSFKLGFKILPLLNRIRIRVTDGIGVVQFSLEVDSLTDYRLIVYVALSVLFAIFELPAV